MKWFIDTEFSERGAKHPIELISIALVSEKGHAIYLVSNEFDEGACNEWVKEHVLPKLDDKRLSLENIRKSILTFVEYHEHAEHGPRDVVDAFVEKISPRPRPAPEFWGYFVSYDWVVFCQIFGRMVDLPKGWPQFARDVRQLMDEYEIKKDQLPPMDKDAAHDALYDARWTREAYMRCRQIAEEKTNAAINEALYMQSMSHAAERE